MTFDPGTLGLSCWLQGGGNYTSGTWVETASAGGSGGNGSLIDATNPPAVGSSTNIKQTSTDFDGTNDQLTNAVAFYSFTTLAAGAGWVLFNANAAGTDGGAGSRFNSPGLLAMDAGGSTLNLTHSTTGVSVDLYDGAWQEITLGCGPGVWTLAQFKWDSTNLKLRLNNGLWSSVTCGAQVDLGVGGGLVLGRNFGSVFANVRMLDVGLANTALADADFDGIGEYCEQRYGRRLGFSVLPFLCPDRIDRPQIDRFRMHAARMQAYAGRSDPPGIALLQPNRPIYPDAIDRRQLARAGMHASRMQSFAMHPVPERKVAPGDPEYVDRHNAHEAIGRVRMHASRMQTTLARNADLVLTKPTTELPPHWVIAPDRVTRGTMRPEQQLAVTTVAPAPERTIAPSDVEWPDRIVRPWFSVGHQLATTAIYPMPERTAPPSDVEWPDTIRRPMVHASQQLATTSKPPLLERSAPVADSEWPDRPARPPWFGAHQQRHVSAPDPKPENVNPHDWSSSHPDAVARPKVLVAMQRETWLDPSPIPNAVVITPIALTSYPDRVVRPTYAPALQPYAGALDPKPEQTVASSWETFWPDRVPRPTFASAQQQAFAANILPIPLPQFGGTAAVTYPDAVRRPAIAAANQKAFTFDPFPLPTAAITQLQTGFFVGPDRVVRPAMPSAHHLATTTEPPAPEMTLSPSDVRFPDRVLRPSFFVALQLAATSEPAQPERTAPAFDAVYPARVTRATYPVHQQLAITATPPAPEQTTPLDWCVVASDRIARPAMPAIGQQPFVGSLQPEQSVALDWSAYVPEVVRRPRFAPAMQQATAIHPAPERTIQQADVEYPDRIVRPALHAAQHPFQAFAPLPIAPTAVGLASYPERTARPGHHPARLPAMVLAPRPIPLTPIGLVSYPDRIERPALHASRQQFFPLGAFLTPQAAIILPACLTGVLTLATTLTGELVEATVYAATLAISSSVFGALTESTSEDGILTLDTTERGITEGCDE